MGGAGDVADVEGANHGARDPVAFDAAQVESAAPEGAPVAGAWPPKPQDLPDPALGGLRGALELEAKPASIEVSEPRFQAAAVRREVASDTPRAVVYDRSNPSGRTRRDAILNVQPVDVARRIRFDRLGAARDGAICALIVFLSLIQGSEGGLALSLAAGAIGGVIGRELSDGPFGWCAGLLLAGMGMSFLAPGVMGFLVIAGLGAAGWLVGFTREMR